MSSSGHKLGLKGGGVAGEAIEADLDLEEGVEEGVETGEEIGETEEGIKVV